MPDLPLPQLQDPHAIFDAVRSYKTQLKNSLEQVRLLLAEEIREIDLVLAALSASGTADERKAEPKVDEIGRLASPETVPVEPRREIVPSKVLEGGSAVLPHANTAEQRNTSADNRETKEESVSTPSQTAPLRAQSAKAGGKLSKQRQKRASPKGKSAKNRGKKPPTLRGQIRQILDENPSLAISIPDVFDRMYPDGFDDDIARNLAYHAVSDALGKGVSAGLWERPKAGLYQAKGATENDS